MGLSLDSTIDLGHGIAMPRLGLGTYKTADGTEVADAVSWALESGYRSIDTASLYGNERGIGQAIAHSGVARSELFVTTKVWNNEQGYAETLAACDRSLERLGTDYLDLYLVHWPVRAHMEQTWRAMEELLAQGKVRAIGVCNHLVHHLEALLAIARQAPVLNQVEFHPWLQQPALQAFCAEHDIAVEAWAPLMKGRVAEEGALAEIASAHGVSPAQVAVRWVLQQGHVVIPKSVHRERIAQNADVFGFELSQRELRLIASLDRGQRLGPDPDTYAW